MQRWADSTCTCSTGTHLRSPGRMRESLAPLPAHSASACPLRWAAPILRSGSPLAGTPCSVRATRRLASSRGRRAGRPRCSLCSSTCVVLSGSHACRGRETSGGATLWNTKFLEKEE
eukprot:1668512-Prymnesium_polylepis.4